MFTAPDACALVELTYNNSIAGKGYAHPLETSVGSELTCIYATASGVTCQAVARIVEIGGNPMVKLFSRSGDTDATCEYANKDKGIDPEWE